MDLTYPDGNTNKGASCSAALSKVAFAASRRMSDADSHDFKAIHAYFYFCFLFLIDVF